MSTAWLFFILVFAIAFGVYFVNLRIKRYRERLINTYTFPPSLLDKINKIYPHLNGNQLNQVIEGLREYFYLVAISNRRTVSMPSKVVDAAWHEFILFTKQYETFCNKVFGRFLHHTPEEVMESSKVLQSGVRLAWCLSCDRNNMDPKNPKHLPLLFAIDEKLDIEDGFKYTLEDAKRLGFNSVQGCGGGPGCGGCGGS